MRAFVIADASKRKAKPVAVLLWELGPDGGQGRFSLEVSTSVSADDLPLSLSFCANRKGRRATSEESEDWVRSRIVPEDRHNIVEVLLANGLSEYDEVSLLAASSARSSDDDYLAYEVELSDELAASLVEADERHSRADWIIDSVSRQGKGPQANYALVELPQEGSRDAAPCESEPPNAAQRIGEQIRAERKGQHLTQKQLAARAGITQTVLSRVESGKGNPTLSLLEEVAAALDMHLSIALR